MCYLGYSVSGTASVLPERVSAGTVSVMDEDSRRGPGPESDGPSTNPRSHVSAWKTHPNTGGPRRPVSFPGPPTISNSSPTTQLDPERWRFSAATFLLLFAVRFIPYNNSPVTSLLFFPVHSIRQQPRHFSSPLRSPFHPTTAMALKIKNDPGLGTSDGLRIPSRRAAASVVARYILTIDVQPTALRAIVDAKLRYKSSRFFPQLPVEIQLQIWEYAVGKGPAAIIVPREFASWGNRERGHEAALVREGKGGIQKWSGAALLSTCRLSREVARRVCMTITQDTPPLRV